MFGRRPPRRRPPLRHAPRPLIRANRLLRERRFLEAAYAFDRLAEGARRRRMPVRAAHLTLQASRAYFANGDLAQALARTEKGLKGLISAGQADRVPTLLGRIVEKLDEQGQMAEAKKLQATIETALDEVGHSLQNLQRRSTSSTKRHGTLPPRCEGCGAALIADEVEWQDASTARCAYCGAVAKTKIM